MSFAQTWLAQPDAGFRPGRVWLASTPDAFVVLAEMQDTDIMTEGKNHNDPLWDLGDTFEVFLRHTARPDYFEFHVAPNGVTLDLHYPRLHAPRDHGVDQYLLSDPHFSSRAVPEPNLGRWRVAMEIPVGPLVPEEFLRETSLWQFSFSRYDCGPGRAPMVSSTTPHRGAGFHRAEEWLQFRVPAFTAHV
ncbi:MAG: hypothetical protein JWM88_1363 [Verrucomicrobia bacterium]|nr:hypothetical protein [Verrucomicrobiota bacterium]